MARPLALLATLSVGITTLVSGCSSEPGPKPSDKIVELTNSYGDKWGKFNCSRDEFLSLVDNSGMGYEPNKWYRMDDIKKLYSTGYPYLAEKAQLACK